MYPFFNFFGISIPLYGVMTALGYAAGIYYCLRRRQAASPGLSKEQVLDIAFYVILGALLGGKLLFILFYWQDFAASAWVDKIRYGFVFLGGFIGAAGTFIYILRKQKIPLLPAADFFIVAVPLGHAIGKIGCFLAGCCYGKISHAPWLAVKFTNPRSLVPAELLGTPLYPVQLMEAAVSFCLFLVLYKLSQTKHKPGFLLGAYMAGYGLIRFCAEFLRGEDEIFILSITQNQITALLVALAGVILLRYKYGRK